VIPLTLCAFVIIALVDLRSIVRQHGRRGLIVYLTVLAVPIILGILMASGVKIPSTQIALRLLFERIFGKIYPP
jgi:hypothetical protein